MLRDPFVRPSPVAALALAVLGSCALVGCGAPEAEPEPAAPEASAAAPVHVVFETELGEVEIALDLENAPISAAHFLRYVEGGHYDGATFYRAVRTADGGSFDIVQGGRRSQPVLTGEEGAAPDEPPFSPIAHETTHDTGTRNERGVLSYARGDPGTANTEFFFNLGPNRILDTDEGGPDRDGFGYATFGRVVRGIEVLDEVQAQPTDGPSASEVVRGQILTEPVRILRARRAP